jgi:N-acetylglucosaminyldiphosphoundecaprenol N-acetyl-beta-D-mannosaminyltransferase
MTLLPTLFRQRLSGPELHKSKIDILGVCVSAISQDGLNEAIVESVRCHEKNVIAYVNLNAMDIARGNEQFREFLNCAAIAYCDGEGVRLGARILGKELPPRIVLTYWIWQLCALCEQNGLTVFFLGSSHEAVNRAVRNVQEKFPRLTVAGSYHGYFEKSGAESDIVVEMINEAKPNLLFVGFGMPVQEFWIKENFSRLTTNVILPAGAMIDYVAGLKGIAPKWMANNGMEWLYRLFEEPKRLWKRYLIGNPIFIVTTILQRVRKWKQI